VRIGPSSDLNRGGFSVPDLACLKRGAQGAVCCLRRRSVLFGRAGCFGSAADGGAGCACLTWTFGVSESWCFSPSSPEAEAVPRDPRPHEVHLIKEEAGPLTLGCYGLFGSHPSGQNTFLWAEGQRRTFYLRSAGLLSVDCTITRTHLQLGMTHYRGGFFFPSRGAGGSLSLSLSLSLSEIESSAGRALLAHGRDRLDRGDGLPGSSGWCREPRGECARSATPRRENRARYGRPPTPSWTTRSSLASSRRSWAAQLPSSHYAP